MLSIFGLRFANELTGSYRLETAEGEKPLRVKISGEMVDVLQNLFTPRARLGGTISLEGLAEERPLEGALELQPLRSVRLELEFGDQAGAAWRLVLEKDFQFADVLRGRITLVGVLHRDGVPCGEARLEVDFPSSFGQFWESLQPKRRG